MIFSMEKRLQETASVEEKGGLYPVRQEAIITIKDVSTFVRMSTKDTP